jgi:hypothetical protein
MRQPAVVVKPLAESDIDGAIIGIAQRSAQVILKAVGSVLLPVFLPADLPRDVKAPGKAENATRIIPGATLSDLEREAIQECLFQTGGNRQFDRGTPGNQHTHPAAQDQRVPVERPAPAAPRQPRRKRNHHVAARTMAFRRRVTSATMKCSV